MQRICEKTEFEVEGWRRIPPLMEILEQAYIPKDVMETLKLEMIQTDPVFEEEVFEEAVEALDSKKLRQWDSFGLKKTIKDSWIYKHFINKDLKQSKIALYVSDLIQVNQNLDGCQLKSVGSCCVVVRGLAKWPKNHRNGIECLELEYSDRFGTRFIPVDFPFFEEIQINVDKICQTTKKGGSEFYNREMNKLGKILVEKKWGKFQNIEKNWYDLKEKVREESRPKYEMLFVRGRMSSYALKFTS